MHRRQLMVQRDGICSATDEALVSGRQLADVSPRAWNGQQYIRDSSAGQHRSSVGHGN